jgi:acetyl-CoA carboxylase biotin carboxyl carrier protein
VTLTSKDVAEITRLLEESTFTELHLEIDGLKISLRRGAPLPSTPPAIGAERAETRPTAPAAAPAAPDPHGHEVAAPLLGTFYRAPKPGAAPFVEVGSPVNEDTIVGIIEVMKLMNTVRAGVRGTVTEIIAADGALVEFGETLMRVRKSG